MWWFRHALMGGANPWFTDYLFHPDGVWLFYQVLSPFNALLSVGLQSFFSLKTTYNLLLIFGMTATGFSTFLLHFYLTKHRLASFVGTLSFLGSEIYLSRMLLHTQLISFMWIPLFMLFSLKSRDQEGWLNPLLAGVSLALAGLCSWYQLMFGGVFLIVFVIYHLVMSWSIDITFGRLILIGIVALVALSPLLVPMIQWRLSGGVVGGHKVLKWSAEIQRFFIPGSHTTLGKFLAQWGLVRPSPAEGLFHVSSPIRVEHSVYVGWFTLILALVGARQKGTRLWQWFAIICGFFALGPQLKLWGAVTIIPLPYYILHHWIPFFQLGGMPVRFAIPFQFAIGVLVSFGVRQLILKWESLAQDLTFPVLKQAIFVAGVTLTILILVGGHVIYPFPTFDPPRTSAYQWLSQQPGNQSVIDLTKPNKKSSLYYQTIHEKPLVGGILSRYPVSIKRKLVSNSIFQTFYTSNHHPKTSDNPFPGVDDARAETRRVFERYNIGYVITHYKFWRSVLKQKMDLTLLHQSDGVWVYGIDSPGRKDFK